MVKVWQTAIAFSLFIGGQAEIGRPRRVLDYAPAPVDNPLKGLVPYAGDLGKTTFPHTLEFGYLPLSALVVESEEYDWRPLEKLLDEIANRGHQAVFRIYVEYPGRKDGIPAFLVEDGLQVHDYRDTTTRPPSDRLTPDYADPRLQRVLTRFVAELGRKYDGDPRIGFITAGLLGCWGEWHTWPRDDLSPGKGVQAEVMAAYESAFKTTPILLRYPAAEGAEHYVANAKRNFGYHDDSFAWGTLDTGKPGDSWFYMPSLKRAGREAMEKWKVRPIGGEIRPEAWGGVFDLTPGRPEIQVFRKCVEATHVSWLMDSGMFVKSQDEGRRRRAEDEVRHMGYEFHIGAVTIEPARGGTLRLKVEIENRGVAPFYYDWPTEFALVDFGNRVVITFPAVGKLIGLLPGDEPRVWDENLATGRVAAGTYKLTMRVANPLPKGNPIRFANATQDADIKGWLTLGKIVHE